MPTAISSEHARLTHSPDACVSCLIPLTVLWERSSGQTCKASSNIDRVLFLGADMVAVHHLASSVHLGPVSAQAGWLQHFKGHVAGWHTTAGVQLGSQTAHQCLPCAKASLESLQIITLNFQR